MAVGQTEEISQRQPLVDIKETSAMLRCSARHIRRLASSGRMPSPLRVGGLVRWRRSEIDDWIAGGCSSPPKRRAK